MKSKILTVGFVLISVFAVAQSNDSKTEATNKSSDARQGSSGRPKMKMTPEKVEAGSESLKTASDVSTGKGPSKVMAQDDWQKQRVAAGDVNGDGKADTATPSSSDVKAPRDAATGQASGKRQHQPVTLKKDDEQKPPSEKK